MHPLRSIILNFVADWLPKHADKPSEPEPEAVVGDTRPDAEKPAPAADKPTPDAKTPTPHPNKPTPHPHKPTPHPHKPTPHPHKPAPHPHKPTPDVDEPAPMPARRSTPDPSPWLMTQRHSGDVPADPVASRWLLGDQRPRGSRRPASVAVLAARRKRAVEAYCAEFCSPALVEKTAAEVLTQARASAGGPPTDQGLLAAARAVAAEHAPAGGPSEHECSQTPSLLAARAGGDLANGELTALERHLDGCMWCQATELKSARAERVFATAISSADPAEAIAEPATPSDEPAPLPGAFTPATAAVAPPPAPPKPSERRRGRALVLGVLAALAVAAGGAVALLGSRHDDSRSIPTAVSTTHATPTRAAHHRATHHRHHAAPRRRHRHRHAAATTSASAPAASAPSSASPSSGTGASTPAASSAPAAAQSTPPASSGSSAGGNQGNGGAGGGSVAAVQQGGLPAQSAPTQGIGSGGSGH
jgi:hypothetical protein